jgi:hypothetical protein
MGSSTGVNVCSPHEDEEVGAQRHHGQQLQPPLLAPALTVRTLYHVLL